MQTSVAANLSRGAASTFAPSTSRRSPQQTTGASLVCLSAEKVGAKKQWPATEGVGVRDKGVDRARGREGGEERRQEEKGESEREREGQRESAKERESAREPREQG